VVGLAIVVVRPGERPDVATVPDPRGAAQQLILEPWPGVLSPDGTPRALALGGVDPLGLHGAPQPLPGGGHVALGIDDVSPVGRPEGFNEFTDSRYLLVVVDADGEVAVEREVPRTGGESVRLLAATADEAILARTPRNERAEVTGPTAVVAHDLDTGQERSIATDLRDGDVVPAIHAGSALSSTLVLALGPDDDEPGSPSASAPCSLSAIDLTSGTQITHVLPAECAVVRGVRLSPDGARVAVAYTGGATEEIHLTVVDLGRSTPGGDVSLRCDEPATCPADPPVEYLGMAWDDDTTLRVALVDLVANPGWNPEGDALDEDDVLIETHTVE
jgi:hypothetical protein